MDVQSSDFLGAAFKRVVHCAAGCDPIVKAFADTFDMDGYIADLEAYPHVEIDLYHEMALTLCILFAREYRPAFIQQLSAVSPSIHTAIDALTPLTVNHQGVHEPLTLLAAKYAKHALHSNETMTLKQAFWSSTFLDIAHVQLLRKAFAATQNPVKKYWLALIVYKSSGDMHMLHHLSELSAFQHGVWYWFWDLCCLPLTRRECLVRRCHGSTQHFFNPVHLQSIENGARWIRRQEPVRHYHGTAFVEDNFNVRSLMVLVQSKPSTLDAASCIYPDVTEIKQGQTAIVYKVKSRSGDFYAIKTPKQNRIRCEAAQNSFRNEVYIRSILPDITGLNKTIYISAEEDFLITDWICGAHFSDNYHVLTPQSLGEVIETIIQMERHGFFDWDLKGENILFFNDGQCGVHPILFDFGLVELFDNTRYTNPVGDKEPEHTVMSCFASKFLMPALWEMEKNGVGSPHELFAHYCRSLERYLTAKLDDLMQSGCPQDTITILKTQLSDVNTQPACYYKMVFHALQEKILLLSYTDQHSEEMDAAMAELRFFVDRNSVHLQGPLEIYFNKTRVMPHQWHRLIDMIEVFAYRGRETFITWPEARLLRG